MPGKRNIWVLFCVLYFYSSLTFCFSHLFKVLNISSEFLFSSEFVRLGNWVCAELSLFLSVFSYILWINMILEYVLEDKSSKGKILVLKLMDFVTSSCWNLFSKNGAWSLKTRHQYKVLAVGFRIKKWPEVTKKMQPKQAYMTTKSRHILIQGSNSLQAPFLDCTPSCSLHSQVPFIPSSLFL